MFSTYQKVKVLPFVAIVKILGLFDVLGKLPERIIFLLLLIIIPYGATNYLSKTYEKEFAQFRWGIISDYYHTPSSASNNVLGAKTKREVPYKIKDLQAPYVTAKTFLIADRSKTLNSRNENDRLAPASTTKLVTALVALDLYEMDDELETPSFCTTVEGSKLGLEEGAILDVNSLMEALLISSSADAACVLATSDVSYTDFVDLMNQKAKELEMENTNFTNPVGLDGVNSSNYSTASDLFKLTQTAMKDKRIQEIVKKTESEVENKKIYNTNRLLWEIPQTIGVKTGTTVEAGEVLIYKYYDEPKDITIIVMGSTDRFNDTKALLNWTLQSFGWE